MRYAFTLFLSLALGIAQLIASNDLVISGQLTQITNGETSPVAGQSVLFTYNGPNAIETWEASTGPQGFYEIVLSGMSTIGPNRIIIITTPGCNGILLSDTVSNQQGTVDFATVNFTTCNTNISNDCEAAFDALPAPNGQGVYFLSNQSAGNVISSTWLLNGVVFATTENAELNLEPGIYEVCLQIIAENMTPAGCQDQTCQTITVSENVNNCEASFTSEVSADNPLRMIFNNTSSSVNTNAEFSWSFGDGETAGTISAEHTYAQGGIYTVCLVAFTPACADTFCTSISVSESGALFLAGKIFGGGQPRNDAKALLYSVDAQTGAYTLIADDATDSIGRYFFGNLSAGTYAVKGRIQPNSIDFSNFSPTWYTNALYWENASMISLQTSGDEYNITLFATENTGGPGEVNGNVDEGPGRYADPQISGVASSGPAAFADVLITSLSGEARRWTKTDANGNYSVTGLDYGTYLLFADVAGLMAIPVEFTISEQVPQSTVNFVLGDVITSLDASKNATIVYPNPSSDGFCALSGFPAGKYLAEVFSLEGSKHRVSTEINNSGTAILDLRHLAPGNYWIKFTGAKGFSSIHRWIRK